MFDLASRCRLLIPVLTCDEHQVDFTCYLLVICVCLYCGWFQVCRFIFIFCSRYAHKFLEIRNPRVLGPAVSPGAVYLASTLQEQVEMLCFQGTSALASVFQFQPEDDDDNMSIISELSRLSSPSRRSSPALARSPSWSPGTAKVKSLREGSLKKSSSFRTVMPLREENM